MGNIVRPEKFFITGFPRSRTAWLANFFTYGDSYCWHEGVNWGKKDHMELDYKYVGDSDSSLPMHTQDLKRYPDAKIVVVERDEDAVRDSLLWMFRDKMPIDIINANMDMHIRQMSVFKYNYPDHYRIPFRELDSVISMEALWMFLVPTMPFPEMRYEALNLLTIESHVPKYLEQVNSWLKGEIRCKDCF